MHSNIQQLDVTKPVKRRNDLEDDSFDFLDSAGSNNFVLAIYFYRQRHEEAKDPGRETKLSVLF